MISSEYAKTISLPFLKTPGLVNFCNLKLLNYHYKL